MKMILTNSTTHQLLTQSFPGFYGNYLLKDKTKEGIEEENLEKEKNGPLRRRGIEKKKVGNIWRNKMFGLTWKRGKKEICWRRKMSPTQGDEQLIQTR